MIQNRNNENPSQKLILLSGNMFDYIVRLLVWAVEGGDKVSKHPAILELFQTEFKRQMSDMKM